MQLNVLTLLTRPGCHLCEDMLAVVRPIAEERELHLEVVDVDSDPDLRARYGEQIPVLLVNERLAFKYRVTASELLRRLRTEDARGWRRFLHWLR